MFNRLFFNPSVGLMSMTIINRTQGSYHIKIGTRETLDESKNRRQRDSNSSLKVLSVNVHKLPVCVTVKSGSLALLNVVLNGPWNTCCGPHTLLIELLETHLQELSLENLPKGFTTVAKSDL